MMSFRLVRPTWLVDIGRAGDLRGAEVRDGRARIGALTRHRDLASLEGCPIVAETVPLIAHEPIRTLGTFGGSVAHGDAASEWCLMTLLLDGEVAVTSRRGTRTVEAERFFLGTFTTDLAPDELLTDVSLRVPGRAAILEHARRRGDYGLVLVGVAFDLDGGRCVRPRIAAGGVDAVPVRLRSAEAALDGTELDAAAIDACAFAASREIDPGSDVHASAEDRRTFTAVLVRRALERTRTGA
jgi:carbon-monoxide dehydrogenase medium subunit